jgi:hypothetical protein
LQRFAWHQHLACLFFGGKFDFFFEIGNFLLYETKLASNSFHVQLLHIFFAHSCDFLEFDADLLRVSATSSSRLTNCDFLIVNVCAGLRAASPWCLMPSAEPEIALSRS